ncbi:hypothetical protein U1872_21060 [Sphingomonas sp. RB3P16]|uniref:hypothetical protein n=1 Tax=Parasphingomonas frigoris TaxID=3096163 RepID=UPI002FC992CD
MLLLLSSNSARRYGDDIVRALAHPRGSDFQFRYDLKYFDPALLARANSDSLASQKAIIAFLNGDKSARTVSLVLCRAVTVRRSALVGSSCILTLTAGDYLQPLTDHDLRGKLDAREQALIPAWSTDPNYPLGKYVIEVDAAIDSQQAAKRSQEMAAFEAAATALSAFERFDKGTKIAFFAVRDLVTADDWRPLRWNRGRRGATYADRRYALQSGYRYDIEIYTYSPSGGQTDKGVTKLVIGCDEKAVRFTTAKELALDSRYDLNRFTFTTDEQLDAVAAGLRLALSIPDDAHPETRETRCDIVLEARFNGWWPRLLLRILLIACGTAAPAIIGVLYKDKMNWGIGAIMFAGALVAGWGAVFPSLRKS